MNTSNTSNTSEITAEVVLDSLFDGQRITTMILDFPTFILPQMLTHKAFSRNTLSQRAMRTESMIEATRYYAPELFFGGATKGMNPTEPNPLDQLVRRVRWRAAKRDALKHAERLAEAGTTKQIANRVLMPFSRTRMLITATESSAIPSGEGVRYFRPWDSFFALRCGPDAQAEIQVLANAMKAAYASSTPQQRSTHYPFITDQEVASELSEYSLVSLSAARCARISYGTVGEPREGDLALAERLDRERHLSPFEHVAVARKGAWANLCGWRSRRHVMEWNA